LHGKVVIVTDLRLAILKGAHTGRPFRQKQVGVSVPRGLQIGIEYWFDLPAVSG